MEKPLPDPRPARTQDLSERTGFDEEFLGRRVPIPTLDGTKAVLLPYTHFSMLMRPDKRLAAISALGIDGEKLMDLDRSGIDWRLDPRLPEDQQTGEKVYAKNDIDRGHLTRRASAVWGDTPAEAARANERTSERANEDTFHYTTAAPQAAKFNQGLELWLGLETYLLKNAADHGRRLIVFTGPIFSDQDPVYRGWRSRCGSSKSPSSSRTGPSPQSDTSSTRHPSSRTCRTYRPGAVDDGDAPPLGPFRTFQVPIRDIAALTGLDMAQLVAVDRMPIATAQPSARVTTAWRELTSPEGLDLNLDLKN